MAKSGFPSVEGGLTETHILHGWVSYTCKTIKQTPVLDQKQACNFYACMHEFDSSPQQRP